MEPATTAQGRQITCPDPVNLSEPDRFLFDYGRVMKIPPRTMQTHQNVHAFGRGPLVCDGEYLSESFVFPYQIKEYRRKRKHWRDALEQLIQPAKPFNEPAIWVTDNWSCGYFHWICDALPRLESVVQRQSLSEFTLLLPYKAGRCGFITESLKPYGLKNVRVLGRFEHLQVRELLVPAHVAATSFYDPAIMKQMHQRFIRHAAQSQTRSDSRSGDRLYISRALASRRRVANEAELLPILKEFDFQIMHAEQETWQSQIQRASQAKILVSNHGAGLTNMIAMSPGAQVFEIRDQREQLLYCYFTLAAAMDLQYFYMLAGRETEKAKPGHANMLVDPIEFRSILERLVQAQAQADRNVA